jgi:hypothetical protein
MLPEEFHTVHATAQSLLPTLRQDKNGPQRPAGSGNRGFCGQCPAAYLIFILAYTGIHFLFLWMARNHATR